MSTVYVMLTLPITLGYIEDKKRQEGKIDLMPLVFLFLLLVFEALREDISFGYIGFQIRRLFL